MELNHLKYFHEVARQGSFTRAARALRVSQPSISKVIKQLEEHHGLKLFDRGKRQVTLTEMGRRFLATTELVFGELGSLETFVRTRRDECAGELLVGASDNLCNYLLPPVLTAFCRQHPAVTPKLFAGTSDEIKAGLAAGRLELGVFYTEVHDAGFDTEKLGFVEFAIVVAAEKGKRAPQLAELREQAFVGSRAADYAKPYPALAMLHSLGVRPKRFIETNNQETQKRLAAEGLGYTIVPRHMVREELKTGKLREVATPRKVGAHLLLCKKKAKNLSRVASVFEAELRKAFSV